MNYQSIGSGGGIKQIKAKTVDFGASDMPLKPEDLDKDGLKQFPMVMGGVVPVVNLPGIEPGELKLDGACWPASISARSPMERPGDRRAEPGREPCPTWRSRRCTAPTVRAPLSSSPTTCRASIRNARAKVGENTVGRMAGRARRQGQRGRRQLSSSSTDGAIGYVEYAYALQNKMTYALLKNHDGEFVAPTAASFQAAAANADWAKAPGFYLC